MATITRTIKDAENKEIQKIVVVDKASTKNQKLIPLEKRVKVYDPNIRPNISGDIRYVTPEMARELLNKNPNNRIPSPANVNTYKEEMLKGEWMIGTDSIGIDTNGDLCNGQHRLLALIQSGLTGVWLPFMEGLNPRILEKADTGKKRSASDVLVMHGIPSRYKSIIASAAKSAMTILQGKADTKIQSTGYHTNSDVLKFVQANEKQIIASAKYAKEFKAKFMDVNTIAFLHFLYCQSNRKEIETFFDEVEAGNLRGEKTAATALRKILIDDNNAKEYGTARLGRKQKIIHYVMHANLFLQGINKKVSVNARTKFPELYEPTKGNMKKTISKWSSKSK